MLYNKKSSCFIEIIFQFNTVHRQLHILFAKSQKKQKLPIGSSVRFSYFPTVESQLLPLARELGPAGGPI